jgi:hypothetical protein
MDTTTKITIATAVLSILAIVIAPIIALRVQRSADEEKERRERKLWIFKTPLPVAGRGCFQRSLQLHQLMLV